MVSVFFTSASKGGQYAVGFILGGLLFGILAGPVMAQSYRDANPRAGSDRLQKQTQDRQHSSSDLPDWAEPSHDRSGDARSTANSGRGGIGKSSSAPPDPPGNPSRVPVDGGVALLAAAGAGYAVRKLNGEDDGEEP